MTRRTTLPAAWMTECNLALARTLWDEGLSTREIGRRVGCSKHAVVGYAHRRGWPPRPSPLGRRKGEVREAAPRLPDKPHHRGAPTPRKRPERTPEELRVTCRPQPLAVPTLLFSRCQWPSGERPDWRWCEAPTEGGGPYCPTHRRQAYERTPHRGDAVYGVAW